VIGARLREWGGRGELQSDGRRKVSVGIRARRPGLHAPPQRLARNLLGRDDPISYEAGWLSSVTYVSALSLWALVSGHWSTWQAARVEVSQAEEITRQQEDPVEDKVVEKMVEQTDVEAAKDPPVEAAKDPPEG
jgi:hypothetical protein